ncbi:sigma-54 dependent transcriptional regulator [Thermogutta sp.]|uniref:sigma-54 interaction domain-containing protein n=1 Tax=Thermogutta sp. TaxID=1962930 RepID=UPI0032207FE1
MVDQKTLLVEIWRAACRHIEIAESVAGIAEILQGCIPFELMIVRRLKPAESALETVAVAPTVPRWLGHRVTPLGHIAFSRLMEWCLRREVLLVTPGRRDLCGVDLESLLGNVPSAVLVGGLVSDGKATGVAMLVGRKNGPSLTKPHGQLLQDILEPLAVSLENDARVRELAVLREAAEAERQSLLARLGRKSLGDTIVGADAGLKHVMERVELVARSDVPVLLLGETGTGKELIARTIHVRSPRAKAPFLRVNCGAIPPELVDSQLFGHERGSFTGAVETHQGWFERADGGTLFLDEIGELPLDAQVRLLQVLQDGTFERVGGRHPITVDVRIIAATHRDLQEMVRTGRFREDLWYRLAVFPIFLPPLRDRLEDIPALARHFAERAAVRFNLPLQLPTEEDIRLLMNYDWPGNIRELAAVIDRAAILGDGRGLQIAKALGIGASPGTMDHEKDKSREEAFPTLEEVNRRHIEEALRRCNGRIEGPKGAAALLGINPHTLRSRMRKLGIPWQIYRRKSGR